MERLSLGYHDRAKVGVVVDRAILADPRVLILDEVTSSVVS